MEHLIPSFQDKNKITDLTVKVSLLEEANPKVTEQNYRNSYNHLQNVECFKYKEGQSC